MLSLSISLSISLSLFLSPIFPSSYRVLSFAETAFPHNFTIPLIVTQTKSQNHSQQIYINICTYPEQHPFPNPNLTLPLNPMWCKESRWAPDWASVQRTCRWPARAAPFEWCPRHSWTWSRSVWLTSYVVLYSLCIKD